MENIGVEHLFLCTLSVTTRIHIHLDVHLYILMYIIIYKHKQICTAILPSVSRSISISYTRRNV